MENGDFEFMDEAREAADGMGALMAMLLQSPREMRILLLGVLVGAVARQGDDPKDLVREVCALAKDVLKAPKGT